MTPKLLVLTPLAIEAWALRKSARGALIVRTGMGPNRSRRAAATAAKIPAEAVAIAGFCGAVDPYIEPGQIVVASTLLGGDGPIYLNSADSLLDALRDFGLQAVAGPVASTDHPVRTHACRLFRDQGAIAVDMESAWLAAAAARRPLAVVRVVVDTPSRELISLATITGGLKAYRSLARVGAALLSWAARVTASPPPQPPPAFGPDARLSDHSSMPLTRPPGVL